MALILSVAVALSMDAFSVGISLGLLDSNPKKHLSYSLLVGIMHFIMPILGSYTNELLFNRFIVNGNRLLAIILLILAIQMLINIKKNKKESIKINAFFLALTVSIDSYFAGLGLESLQVIKKVQYLVFSFMSYMFSFIGCKLGLIGKNKLDKFSKYIAVGILFLLGIKFLLN